MRRLVVVVSCLAMAGPAFGSGRVISARGSWAAIDRGTSCEAVGRAARIAPKGKVQAVAGFTFSVDHRRWGEFHARLRRLPRAGASVILRAGGQPFLLIARGNDAWSANPQQDQAIMTLLRSTMGMTIEARDVAGRRFVDIFPSEGAATAIDAAAAACAGKIQRR